MIKLGCVLIVFLTTSAFSQNTAPLTVHGVVRDSFSVVEGIYVINLKTEEAAITDDQGNFAITAHLGETLLFSGGQYKSVRILLTDTSFQNGILQVKMTPIMNELNEVVIKRYNSINAVSLGIIPANQISYTAAERKLKTATSLNATANAGSMAGGSISADPLLNFISGRTAMLKKEIAVEKKEGYLDLLERMFDKNHFINKLKIPVEYVKGFEYYAVENEKFTKILNSKNMTTTEFLLAELATKYKEIIACENE